LAVAWRRWHGGGGMAAADWLLAQPYMYQFRSFNLDGTYRLTEVPVVVAGMDDINGVYHPWGLFWSSTETAVDYELVVRALTAHSGPLGPNGLAPPRIPTLNDPAVPPAQREGNPSPWRCRRRLRRTPRRARP
jgi:hypothetical protein